MDDRSSRIFVGLCVLVVVWIGVYWMWEPGGADAGEDARISIADDPLEGEPGDDTGGDESPGPVEIVNAPTRPDPDERAEPQPDRGPRVVRPEFRTYVVRRGQTLQDIARIEYGRASRWSVIARANPRVDPIRLREGMELRIPVDPGNVQGREVASDEEAGGETGGAPATADDSLVVEYVVQPGDSLSKIAQDFYGSARYTDFLYEANRGVLRSKNAIRVGQTLRLPPLDSTSEEDGDG